MTTYNPTAVKMQALELPNDGITKVNAASVNAALQAIADGLKFASKSVIAQDINYPTNSAQFAQYGYTSSLVPADVANVYHFSDLEIGDRIKVCMTFHAKMSTAAPGWLKLALGADANRFVLNQGLVGVNSTDYRQYTIVGFIDRVLAHSSSPYLYLLGQADGGTLTVANPIGFSAQVLRSL